MTTPEFELSSKIRGDAVIVKVLGDLDVTTCRQLDETLSAARTNHRQIIIDLSAVEFMDTSSLAVIVSHWKGARAGGGSLSLAGARYQYTRTLWITGLADRIPMYDSVELAVAGSQPAATRGD